MEGGKKGGDAAPTGVKKQDSAGTVAHLFSGKFRYSLVPNNLHRRF